MSSFDADSLQGFRPRVEVRIIQYERCLTSRWTGFAGRDLRLGSIIVILILILTHRAELELATDRIPILALSAASA